MSLTEILLLRVRLVGFEDGEDVSPRLQRQIAARGREMVVRRVTWDERLYVFQVPIVKKSVANGAAGVNNATPGREELWSLVL